MLRDVARCCKMLRDGARERVREVREVREVAGADARGGARAFTITSGRTPARPMCLRARSAAMRPPSPTIWSKAAPKARRCSAVGSQLGCFGRSTAGNSLGSTSPATRRVTRCIAVQNSSREKRPSPSPSASSQITSRSSLGRRERARKRCASAPPTVSDAVAPSTLRKTP